MLTRQPAFAGAVLDAGNPLAKGIELAYVGSSPKAESSNKRRAAGLVGPWGGMVAGPGGASPVVTNAVHLWFERDASLEPTAANGFSWAFFGRRTGTGLSWGQFFRKTYNNNGSDPYITWSVENNPEGLGQNRMRIACANGSTVSGGNIDFNVTDTTKPFVAVGARIGTRLDAYYDGVPISSLTSLAGTSLVDATTTGRIIIGGGSSSSLVNTVPCDVYLAVFWSRFLTASEALSFSVNPWQIFVDPAQRRMNLIRSAYVAAGGAPRKSLLLMGVGD